MGHNQIRTLVGLFYTLHNSQLYSLLYIYPCSKPTIIPNALFFAEDLDNNRNSQLLYSLLSEEGVFQEARPGEPATKRFSVDATSGDIIVGRQVEALTTYILNISAQDEGGLSTITQIILRINDTNNNRWV